MTLRHISSELNVQFDVDVTPQCVAQHLDGLCYSIKQSRPEPVNMNSDEVKSKRKESAATYMAKMDDGFTPIFEDETNFNVFCKRSNGRSKKGTRVHVKQPTTKGPNLHCIGAISPNFMLMLKTRRGSLKADDFFDFLSTIVDKCIERNIRKALILIDNAPAHSKAEKQLAEKLQNVNSAAFESIELLRLSPYSPALNPIENYWSKFKGKLKDEM